MAILRIRDKNGQVQEIVALKGEKGDSGYTPQRGTDYWTEADKAEIKNYIDEQFGDVGAALDEIIETQQNLIGGDAV